jgi:hypothetical protein
VQLQEVQMLKMLAMYTVAVVVASAAGSLAAHHSLANHDTTTPVRVKGKVVRFHAINPHSFIILEETDTSGASRRWAVEGPAAFQLTRRGVVSDGLKPGDVIEVCGYELKERTIWQMASATPGDASLSGRLITAELLVMPDGRVESWGDYGVHRCFRQDYRDQHAK